MLTSGYCKRYTKYNKLYLYNKGDYRSSEERKLI
jgi:hypothetical protein